METKVPRAGIRKPIRYYNHVLHRT